MFNLKPAWPKGASHSSNPWNNEPLNTRYVAWCEKNDPDREVLTRVVLGRGRTSEVPADAGTWKESFRVFNELRELGWIGWVRPSVSSRLTLRSHRTNWVVHRAERREDALATFVWGLAMEGDQWLVKSGGLRALRDHPNVLEMSIAVPNPTKEQGYENVPDLPEDKIVGMFELFQWLAKQRANGVPASEVFLVDVQGKGFGFRVRDDVRWVTMQTRRDGYTEWAKEDWESLGLSETLVKELTLKPASRVALARGACPWDL